MFCSSCGGALAANLRFCDNCGAEVGGGGPVAGVPLAQQLRSEVHARSLDAWQGIKLFARNPVGGLPESFAKFDDQRAIQVGITFAIVYEIALFLGVYILMSRATTQLGDSFAGSQLSGYLQRTELSAIQLFKVIIFGLVPFASLTAASAIARAVFRGNGRFAGDVYTAGAVLLPSGFLVVVAALLGLANIEVILVLFLFAQTYSILMLYAGCARIAGIPEAGSAPAVPIMLLASGWITKIIVTALW